MTGLDEPGGHLEVQLRRYLIKEGKLDQFITEWRTEVVPLREQFGFTFLGAWSLPESSEFVWVVGCPRDFDDADRVYYESDERKQMDPDPAVHIDESQHSVADIVL